jgi:hypothetical protein
MTLHLLRTSNSYTLMVSDRLVSGRMTDALANKNLIYHARDAIVAIGYAGRAYGLNLSNSNMPSDEWLAEKLWGKPIERGPDGVAPATFTFGKISKHLNVGQSINLLRNELIASFDALPRSDRKRVQFHLVLAGWRESRHGISYILTQIKRSNDTFKIETAPRYYYRVRTGTCVLSFPDGYISQTHLSDIAGRLKPLTPDESESLLVEEIRRVAALHPDKVGPHCLSILLPPQPTSPIRVRFIPTVEHTAVVTLPRRAISKTLGVAFSPWVIGPRILAAPAVMNGNSTLHLGPIRINIEAPASQQGITLHYSLRRPPGI